MRGGRLIPATNFRLEVGLNEHFAKFEFCEKPTFSSDLSDQEIKYLHVKKKNLNNILKII